jgi:glycosyltransferase involved in cell wall biosynthesis
MEPIETHPGYSRLSIIVPVFNEELLLHRFRDLLYPTLVELKKSIDVQVCFVNNGSTDSSLKILSDTDFLPDIACAVITLSRNFGYETALIAGLTHSDSELFCLLDADGEDDPVLMLNYLSEIYRGSDVVQGIRRKRFESVGTRWFRSFSYLVLSRLSDDSFIRNGGNFAMFTRRVRDAILAENVSFPFLRSTFSRCGYSTFLVPYDRLPRIDGKSKYRKFSLLKFALAGFLTTTTFPLRLISYFGILSVPFVFLVSGLRYFFPSSSTPLLTISIIVTEILLSLGLISLYLARIYKETLGKPLFYVDWCSSFSTSDFVLKKHNTN